MKFVKIEQARISSITSCVYFLAYDNKEYSVICREYGNDGEIKDESVIKGVTPNEKTAEEILSILAKNGVCACTLADVVIDLIC